MTDFGLVRQLDADSGQTFDGVVMGTPSYMAPEQAEGRARSAGPPPKCMRAADAGGVRRPAQCDEVLGWSR